MTSSECHTEVENHLQYGFQAWKIYCWLAPVYSPDQQGDQDKLATVITCLRGNPSTNNQHSPGWHRQWWIEFEIECNQKNWHMIKLDDWYIFSYQKLINWLMLLSKQCLCIQCQQCILQQSWYFSLTYLLQNAGKYDMKYLSCGFNQLKSNVSFMFCIKIFQIVLFITHNSKIRTQIFLTISLQYPWQFWRKHAFIAVIIWWQLHLPCKLTVIE